MWARVLGHTGAYDQFASMPYQVTIPPLIAVAFHATPASPQCINTPITLECHPYGRRGAVGYLFRVGYSDAAGWHWTNLQSTYTTTASCTWTPTVVRSYTLVVWARILGHTANYDVYASQGYQITPLPISQVTLIAAPASPQQARTAIVLSSATPQGGTGGQVEYLFRAGYSDAAGWHWQNLQSGYTTTASCTWTPTVVGGYTLVVSARLVGQTVSYAQYAEIPFQVTEYEPISAVTSGPVPPRRSPAIPW